MSSDKIRALAPAYAERAHIDHVLAGGGESGALLRAIDWRRTPLGPVSSWPQALRAAVSHCLNSRFPIFVWWGPQMVKIYNDAGRALLGARHPGALGARGREGWPAIWHLLGPVLDRVLAGGEPTWAENQLVYLDRSGFLEECYFTLSYSPIRAGSGGVGGVYCTVVETTGQVVSERRMRALQHLAARTTGRDTAADACRRAAQALAEDVDDVRFALVYLLEPDGRRARLEGAGGQALRESLRPDLVALDDGSAPWPLADALRAPEGVRSPASTDAPPSGVTQGSGSLAAGARESPAVFAVVRPIALPGEGTASAVLVAGLSPHLAFDDRYREFFALAAGQIASGIASARALEEAQRRHVEAEEARARIARTEEELRQTIAVRDAFVAAASHELRTPLTTLELQLDGLIRALGQAPEDATTQRWLARTEKVRAQTNRLEQLIESMLEVFGNAAEPPRARAPGSVDLAEVAKAVVHRVRGESKQALAAIVLRTEPVTGEWDRERLDSVLSHLIANALKFGGGKPVDVVVEPAGAVARLTVLDRGIGIALADHERIFQRFERAASANHYGGFGLGLWIVRQLVASMGGTVRVDSRPDEGATFVVELPRRS